MFKFSYNWLVRESDIPVDYDKLMKWLAEQGFEIASLSEQKDDKVIEIEVKANRPDMLYVAGVLREYYCSCGEVTPKEYQADLGLKYSQTCAIFDHKINICSKDVHRYYALGIKNVDNTVETPDYIADALQKVGVTLINPVVDISNYVMLLIGQPTHVFDADKVDGDILISNSNEEVRFTTLAGTESTFPSGTVFIEDSKDRLCVAGIIGGQKTEVDCKTKNIILESANFDHVIERWASKKSHVTTLASYRYERGVSVDTAILGLNMVATLITEVCGGDVCLEAFEYTDGKEDSHEMQLSAEQTNQLLGSQLTSKQIKEYLEKCYFKVTNIKDDVLNVVVPAFRLDVDDPVDLIEEVGRMYGYHNIVPQPVKLGVPLKPNYLHIVTRQLRRLMVANGGIECLTYGFIPDNSMELLNIPSCNERFYGDIRILNPLSNYYALMRPTMAFNMITTAVDNIKSGCKKINIFELGKTYFRDPDFENGYNQRSTLAAVLCGVNQTKGFGIIKDNMYTIYDMVSLLNVVFNDLNIEYAIIKTNELGFLKRGSAGYITVDCSIVGCIGVVDESILEKMGVEKIINSAMLYFEVDYDAFIESKKQIRHERQFPSVKREYNFIVPNGKYFSDYKDAIFAASPIIISVKPTDVYTGKGVEKGTTSVLIEVEYNATNRPIDLNELVNIEETFYSTLESKYSIVLKK